MPHSQVKIDCSFEHQYFMRREIELLDLYDYKVQFPDLQHAGNAETWRNYAAGKGQNTDRTKQKWPDFKSNSETKMILMSAFLCPVRLCSHASHTPHFRAIHRETSTLQGLTKGSDFAGHTGLVAESY